MAKAAKTKEQTKAQVLIGGDSESLDKPSTTSGSFYKKVRTMRTDSTISLVRELVAAPLLVAEWSMEADDNAPPDALDILTDNIIPLRLHLLKTSFYGCFDFGWQPYEKVFYYDDITQKILVKKVKPLLQDNTLIQIDKANGSFQGFKQDDLILDLDSSLLVNIDVEGTDWYGQPKMKSLEGAYDNWIICNNANIRHDSKIAGAHWIIEYPVGKTPFNGVDTDNFVIAQGIMSQLQSSGTVIIPKKVDQFINDANESSGQSAWTIRLESAYPTAQVGFIDRLKYLDALKARGSGMPERATLEGQFGTKAEAEAHADFAISNMELRHEIMVQHYNWHLVNQLLRLNWGPEFENTVWISVAPITDLERAFFSDIYKLILANPETLNNELLNMDTQAIRDRLSVPTLATDTREAVDEEEAQKEGTQIALSYGRLIQAIGNGRFKMTGQLNGKS